MKTALPILVSATLVGCTAEPPRQPVAAAAVAGAQECIHLDQVTARRVQPPNSVVFDVGPVSYRNDLIGPCPSIARLGESASIELESPLGKQLCRNDHIRVFDPVETKATGIRSAPLCRLGVFVPVPRG